MEGSGENQERYPCNFCDKVFFSYQALGGHQNSHKEERDVAVMRLREAHLSFPTARTYVPNAENMHVAPRMQPNLLLPTMRTHAPNNINVKVPHHPNYYFRRPTYLPARSMIPRESYFHPYASPNHSNYQNNNPYNGFRYPSTNPFQPTSGYPTYRLPLVRQQINTYVEPRMYDFFAAENGGMMATNSQVKINNLNPSIGGEERTKENTIVAPSNATSQEHIGEDVNEELDLTLRL